MSAKTFYPVMAICSVAGIVMAVANVDGGNRNLCIAGVILFALSVIASAISLWLSRRISSNRGDYDETVTLAHLAKDENGLMDARFLRGGRFVSETFPISAATIIAGKDGDGRATLEISVRQDRWNRPMRLYVLRLSIPSLEATLKYYAGR